MSTPDVAKLASAVPVTDLSGPVYDSSIGIVSSPVSANLVFLVLLSLLPLSLESLSFSRWLRHMLRP